MKRLIFVSLLIITLMTICDQSKSQSCMVPACEYSVVLTANPNQNQVNNFNNAPGKAITCFTGNSSINRITNNMSLNGIEIMIFKANAARYECLAPINLQGNKNNKIYIEANADLTINQLSMGGGDTIFVAGRLTILSVQNVNNSTVNNKAVILLQPGGSVNIAGNEYSINTTYQSSGNSSNVIYILRGCIGGLLPVKFIKIDVKHYVK